MEVKWKPVDMCRPKNENCGAVIGLQYTCSHKRTK